MPDGLIQPTASVAYYNADRMTREAFAGPYDEPLYFLICNLSWSPSSSYCPTTIPDWVSNLVRKPPVLDLVHFTSDPWDLWVFEISSNVSPE